MIKVLAVDDSLVVRNILVQTLNSDPEIEVIGTASNGQEAIDRTLSLRPDVILMDVDMPRMDGIEATRQIMTKCPTPILIVTSSAIRRARNLPFAAIKYGAVDLCEKPQNMASYREMGAHLIKQVKVVSKLPVFRLAARDARPPSRIPSAPKEPVAKIVAIGASTGGPSALNQIFRRFPEEFPVPVVVVQHIGEPFLPGLVDWLEIESTNPVRIARAREVLYPGTVFFAPPGYQMTVGPMGTVRLSGDPPVNSCRPSIDVLFGSVAQSFGSGAVAALLTGMGEDGAEGMAAIKKAGGHTLAQDQDTSLVFGMPRAAMERGGVDNLVPLELIARKITDWL